MKKFIVILLGLVFISLQAQNLPQGISYQAVAIKKEKVNLGGENLAYIYWTKKDIVVRFSIYDTYPNGSVEYSETHDTKTDDYGVFNLIIGKGDKISGNFESINWELGDAHLKIEIDFDGFGAFELIGVEKFWSVPYAFVSKKQSNNNSQSDSLFSDLYGKYDYLRNRDKDTVIGNEGGVSYEYLDSLNRVLLDSIGKLQNIVSRDKDTVIGNEWQDLIKSADSVLITNGSGIKLLDDDSTNELQDLFLKNDSLYLTKSSRPISINSFKDSLRKSSFTSIGDSSYFIQLNKSPVVVPHCVQKKVNYFGIGVVAIRSIVEVDDSVYYFGNYQRQVSPFEKGEFIVSKSKLDCGAKLIYKTLNTRLFTNVDGTGNAAFLGSYKKTAVFLNSNRITTNITKIELPNLKITNTLLKSPTIGSQPYAGFEKNITNLLVYNFFKDTIYLIYNNFVTTASSTYNGPNRLYKYNALNGELEFVDSVTDYTSFGTGSNLNGFIQFYDSLLIKSNPITQEIEFYNLMNLKISKIWSNQENFNLNYMKNLNTQFKFRYFPNTKTLFIPSTVSSLSDAIIYSINTKKTILDNDYVKFDKHELFFNNYDFSTHRASNNEYVQYFNDWNYGYYYLKDPDVIYFK